MASPFARIIAQLVVSGASIFSRAFVAAYSQAVQNARKGTVESAKAMSRTSKMSEGEALQILNLSKNEMKPDLVSKQFKYYFDANNPDKGGSFYLQSKVYRANEALMEHFELLRKQAEQEKKQQTAGSGPLGSAGTKQGDDSSSSQQGGSNKHP